MNIIIFTPSSHVEKLKQKARKLKNELGLTHHEALDQVAKKYRYHHWHHVTEMAAITEPSEISYRNGLLVAFDVKTAQSFNNEFFVEDSLIQFFLEEELLKIYSEMDDEDEDLHALPEMEQDEYFQDFMDNMIFYRYIDKNTPTAIEDALKLISAHSMFMPEFVWLKGKLCENYDTYGASEPD